ncbi:beta-ketoacyl synthase N-terminal-like domain-containing protein [Phytohabitans flavus]|uniref:beta-ketoacyl [acyl carrier protein] synthase domain-containing protein n=1 Tax=Phytohabitans flavus TaxID=1076124 RepID=UPI00363704D1
MTNQTAVAVTGIGCRAPGARDHRELFDNLCRGVSTVSEIDPQRWDPADFYSPDISIPNKTVSKWCGQIDEPYGFDDSFFRLSPKTAKLMDPQQRLLLEETWHCVEDSGTPLRALQQARTLVFVGVAARDHLQQGSEPGTTVEAYTTFGGSDYMLANRISHAFGLRGQSMAIDAACASSAVAIHLGIRALLDGDADFVLAGGVLLNLHPWKYISYSKARMLSPSGLCRTFDKDADGFVPGDGVGMVMLRRLDDAVRDGDHVYGLLMGSAVNHNGAGRTITAPSVAAQRDVITAALDRAGFDQATVGYVEAHGTGTPLGDPIEVEALHRVMSGVPREDGGCWIGSVKPNIGHLEAAAGVAGLVKVLMMMAHRRIPPSVHLSTVNPLIKVDDGVLRLAREATAWEPVGDQPLRAGVSSFGGGGVNAHLCVEEHRPAADTGADPLAGTPSRSCSPRPPPGRWNCCWTAGGRARPATAGSAAGSPTSAPPWPPAASNSRCEPAALCPPWTTLSHC